MLCARASCLLCISLKENKTEWGSKNLLSKGTCHFISWWGYLAKSQGRLGKALELGDWHVQLPSAAVYRDTRKQGLRSESADENGVQSKQGKPGHQSTCLLAVCYMTRRGWHWCGCVQTQKKEGGFFMRKLKWWCWAHPHGLLLLNEDGVMGNVWRNW